ncbi:GNAT family N-acetyltransferase [Paenibacillus polymyxa]|uniref:GNAT family N-acetyltransferase n=1 Tax=Paenibacillus polymyxa TaxID=1406 RepID=UPI002024DF60|nr:GNAT family N-acetyltransferase [Paenibacillus polymyxa]MDN4084788.1 GNAT family N-acetyltransferase [Paenibacillus polymyxa]MDN4086806.1 GNAT family N-acetyltransferase [Paenibacillus polymyxa]MDN4108432.1 GNAT family N-acetyltransferase [Paenibacillus polymyxa]URJ37803.1 GNAT family N-acetyltransferase [Paenibacillus polymyxa]
MTLEPQWSRSSRDEARFVRNKLIEFNATHVPADIQTQYEEINLTLKNGDGQVIGGLLSVLCWNWVEVDILWVDQGHRGKGYGSQLLSEIEQIARDKGCTLIQLNTFSFQAPEFYEKQGYEVVGVIDEAPRGFKHYYYKKNIY